MSGCDTNKIETVVYVSMFTNLSLSLLVIVTNAILLYLLRFKMVVTTAIDDSSTRFQEATKAAEFARMPVVGIMILSELANISYNEVIREYEKDAMERRAIVYDIFGRDATIRKFINEYPSQFLRNGYDGESLLLAQQTQMSSGQTDQAVPTSTLLDSGVM